MKPRLILIAVIFTSLALSACAPSLTPQELQGTIEISIALTALAQTAAAPASTTAAPASTAESTSEPTIAPATEAPAGPEVVFLAEGSFSADGKTQIRTRVVEPFILYYRTTPDYPHIVSITIETVPDVADYPYKAEAIFEGGGNAGWLIHVTGGLVDWWIPDCMDVCPLSDEFRAAYPEIVAILEP
jgi:hypothetical protein